LLPEKAGIMKLRSLFAAFSGVFLIVGGIVPRADADVLVSYFNFEDSTLGGPIDLTPDLSSPTTSNLTIDTPGLPNPVSVAGIPLNVAPGDADPNLLALGFRFTPNVTPSADITFHVSTLGLTNLSLSFAINNNGNGFSTATFQYSTDGINFTTPAGGMVTLPPPPGGNQRVAFNYPSNVDNQAIVYFRVSFTGGISQGTNLQTVIDNIQLTVVPEPATVGGGLLGVVGLCWFQRRRLIRSVRFRRTSA
jgi:hypothetical protein